MNNIEYVDPFENSLPKFAKGTCFPSYPIKDTNEKTNIGLGTKREVDS